MAEWPPRLCWDKMWSRLLTRALASLSRITGRCGREQPSEERTRRLGEVIVQLLRESGAEAAARDGDPLLVVFRHGGRPFVMGLSGEGAARGAEFAEAVHSKAAGASVLLLSMSGFAGQVTGAGPGGVLLWDRSHLGAAMCGLVTLPDLAEASSRALSFHGAAYETLAGLLAVPAGGRPAGTAMRRSDRAAADQPDGHGYKQHRKRKQPAALDPLERPEPAGGLVPGPQRVAVLGEALLEDRIRRWLATPQRRRAELHE